jgi:hypothetical protein
MKISAFLTFWLLLAAAPLEAAQPYTTIDPLGHKSVLNEGGALPSPEGTHFTFSPIDADVEVILQGSGGDATGSENVLLGLTPMVFVARPTAIGFSLSKPDLSNPDWLRFSPTLKHYIAVGPEDSWLKFVKFQPCSYSFATGSEAGFSGGKFSADFKLTAGAEIPLGANLAFQVEAGVLATFTSLGEDVKDTTDPLFGGTFVYRIRPNPRG